MSLQNTKAQDFSRDPKNSRVCQLPASQRENPLAGESVLQLTEPSSAAKQRFSLSILSGSTTK